MSFDQRKVLRDSLAVAIPVGSYGVAFGAAAVSSGFSVAQSCVLSLFLFSGALYPLSIYPLWLQRVIEALPLWHGISIVRALCLGEIHWGLLAHLAYFVTMIAVGLVFTTRRLRALFMR